MTLVIYDSMPQYASELARYLAQHNSDIHTAAFAEKEEAAAWCRCRKTDILLAAEELLDETLREVPVGQLVLLSEEDPAGAEFPDGLPRVGRYQSADEILSEVLMICRPSAAPRTAGDDVACADFTVFYAPSPCPLQASYARAYAAGPDTHRRILYLCLQENAELSGQSTGVVRRDLSDLLYLHMHGSGDFQMLLRSMVCEDDGITCVPPPELTADLFEADQGAWSAFLDALRTQSGFDEVVFDLSFLFPAAFEILDLAKTIYLPVYQTEESQRRLRRFLRVYERRYGPDAHGKLREIRISAAGPVS